MANTGVVSGLILEKKLGLADPLRHQQRVDTLCHDSDKDYYFAGSGFNAQIWRSADYGNTWNKVEDLSEKDPPQVMLIDMIYDSVHKTLVAGTYPQAQLWVSEDHGKTWSLSKDLWDAKNQTHIKALGFHSYGDTHTLVAGTWPNGQIWYSRDGGVSWSQAKGWPSPAFINCGPGVASFASDPENDIILAGCSNGRLKNSTDGGKTWSTVVEKEKLDNTPIASIAYDSNTKQMVLVTGGKNIYVSPAEDDQRTNFQHRASLSGSFTIGGLAFDDKNNKICLVTSKPALLFEGTASDGYETWIQKFRLSGEPVILDILIDTNNNLALLSTYDTGQVWRASTSDYSNWEKMDQLNGGWNYQLAVTATGYDPETKTLLAATFKGSVMYKSTNEGENWMRCGDFRDSVANAGLESYAFMFDSIRNKMWFSEGYKGRIWLGTYPYNFDINKCEEYNLDITECQKHVAQDWVLMHEIGYRRCNWFTHDTVHDVLFCSTGATGGGKSGAKPSSIFISKDGGETWEESLAKTESFSNMFFTGKYVYAGTYPDGKIYKGRYPYDSNDWIEVASTGKIFSGTYKPGAEFALWGASPRGYIIKHHLKDDWYEGQNETIELVKNLYYEDPLHQDSISSLAFDSVSNVYYAGTWPNAQLWRGNADATEWELVEDISKKPLSPNTIHEIIHVPEGDYIFFGTADDGGVYKGYKCNPDGTDEEGVCDVDCGASEWCEGKEPEQNIPYCGKGGETYFHDKCGSNCQPVDRGDDHCVPLGKSDCTGAVECTYILAGSNTAGGYCNLTCDFERTYTGMSYLENGMIKVGIGLDHGGVITSIIDKSSGREFVNTKGPERCETLSPGRLIGVTFNSGKKGIKWNTSCQAGNHHCYGAPVLKYEKTSNQTYTKTQSLEFLSTDNNLYKLTDIIVEQWITLKNNVIKVDYKVTHTGDDEHPEWNHEFPYIHFQHYPDLTRIVTYNETNPWTYNETTELSREPNKLHVYNSKEGWQAYVDRSDFGITVAVIPTEIKWRTKYADFSVDEYDVQYTSINPKHAIPPDAVYEKTVYFIIGDYKDARRKVYKKLAHLNSDGIVDILDLAIVTSHFGGWSETVDVVEDGVIDIYDVVFVASRFG